MNNPRLRQVGGGQSFFHFIEEFCLAEKQLTRINIAMHRFCSLMRKMDVKTVVIEDIDSSYNDIQKEYFAIETRLGQTIEIRTYKFTFLSEQINSLEEIPELKDEKFLSSAILINFKEPEGSWISYIYSAIVTIPKLRSESGVSPLLNNYLHVCRTFPCELNFSDVDTHHFEIKGTFFCQQNTKTSVCGHASLCMTINNMNLQNNGLISAEDINKIIGVDHVKRRFDSRNGLAKKDIYAVLEHYGLSFTEFEFFEAPNYEYNEVIYNYIESRCPVLLIFSTYQALHIVTVLGHTLNSDMWEPEAQYFYANQCQYVSDDLIPYKPAAAWVDHFIIHDDNFGMYCCLPVNALKRVTLPKYDPTFRSRFAIMLLPKGVTTPAYEAEYASVKVLKHILGIYVDRVGELGEWTNRIIAYDKLGSARPLVVRLFLATKEDYEKSLDQDDFEGNRFSTADKTELIKDLPPLFWLSEITMPDLYTTNKTKIVDFFYASDLPNLTMQNVNDIFRRWIQIRFPEALLKQNIDGTFSTNELSVKSHYPLLRFESEYDVLEW